jgi:hypothetical protein
MLNPSKDWKEIVVAGEEARFARFASQLVELQKMNALDGRPGRALHHKTHCGLEARLEVAGDLPEPLRQGLFAGPKVYDALVRFSNGSTGVKSDDEPDVRGMAVKVLGVDGPKVIGTARTQDFLAILQSVTPFRTADEFVATVWASRTPALALPRMLWTLGLRMFSILPKFIAAVKPPVASLADRHFFSALPIQCGPYAVRFTFVPIRAQATNVATTGPSHLADDLGARLLQGAIEYALELQFFVDEKRTPIEDGSVDWPVDIAPYHQVAKLVIPQQDIRSDRGRHITDSVVKMAFDPWHALVEHRPLGGMMRARRPTYFASAQGRAAEAEPDGPIG